MKICKGYGSTLFISKYDEENNLIQKLTNVIANDDGVLNRPVDFLESGLAPVNCSDEWTLSSILAINTDEAVPPRINSVAIGGNHGQPCAIDVICNSHGKTCQDVGSVYQDEKGVNFYLVQVPNQDVLTLVSENLGESKDNYEFKTQIDGNLKYVRSGTNKNDVLVNEQNLKYLTPAIRHEKIDFFAFKEGVKKRVVKSEDAEIAQIHEVYYVINPATVGPALEEARPNGGYPCNPIISDFGERMLRFDATHLILDDGTYINDFNHTKLTDVEFTSYMGVMAQARRDFFGGGIFRYLPKTIPFTTEEGTFDFSKPKSINSPFPKRYDLTKDSWSNPDSPPDRCIDIFRDKKGHDKMGFVCGFLPVFDGHPSQRKNNLSYAFDIRNSLKIYPVFKDGNLQNARGIAYKKYFKIDNDNGYFYTITLNGVRYIYCDTFSKTKIDVSVDGKIEVVEISSGVSFSVTDKTLSVKSDTDSPQYAVFKELL